LEALWKEGEKQFEGRPFDVVKLISYDNTGTFSTEIPLIVYKAASDKGIKDALKNDFTAIGKQALDIALLELGIKNLAGATTLLKQDVTVRNVARLILGSADLAALGLYSACSNSNSEFCQAYKEYELLINLGLLSANILNEIPALYNSLRKGFDEANLTASQRTQLREILGEEGTAVQGIKLRLLSKFNELPNLKAWVNTLDDVADKQLLIHLDELDNVYLSKLNTDIVHARYGTEIKTLLRENPNDLVNIWQPLKDDPAYAWELSKESDWSRWSQREFFKDVTGKGKAFEETVCLNAFKNRTSREYLELKQKFSSDFGKNLDDYDMYSQVQLYYSGDNYFVADQVFVKYATIDGQKIADDILVIENKLSSTTTLTAPQNAALRNNSYKVRSINEASRFDTGVNLIQNMTLKFSNEIQWYKVYDGTDGNSIHGIINIK
jgi:hypothetical protein